MPKKWGIKEFWGLGSDFDCDWLLTEEQIELRDNLIELCRTTIRPNAAKCDKDYVFPRESLDALASLGLFGLIVPKELGGMGQNHVCCVMVFETIARYGCPSTALVFCMHILGSAMALFMYAENEFAKGLLRNINKDKILMTCVFSDPATGGHFWFPFTSKMQEMDEGMIRIFKYCSWVTSAGHADAYIVCTTSPKFKGDYSEMTLAICLKDEVRAFCKDWSAMGMHGNMSSEMVVDCKIPEDRIVGKHGYGALCDDETIVFYYTCMSACWNGLSLACMDLAKKYVTRKSHGDQGMRICDYSSIQDYFGECVTSTSMTRLSSYQLAQRLDQLTNNNDFSLIAKEPIQAKRCTMSLWMMQLKHASSKNVDEVSNLMLKTCGGVGFKTELGLERLFRDSKAATIMATSNEMVRLIIGKTALMGSQAVDLWQASPNRRVLNQEISKMTTEQKKELARELLETTDLDDALPPTKDFDDFDNPFSTEPPTYPDQSGKPALHPESWVSLMLKNKTSLTDKSSFFSFTLPESSTHSGLIPGQYIQCRVKTSDNAIHERYFSPVSLPTDRDNMQLMLKFESHGIVSEHFQNLKPGDSLDFRGPCGGFEYYRNTVEELTLLAAGGAVTPAIQILRSIAKDAQDMTKVNLLYYSDTIEDILFHQELKQLNEKDERVTVQLSVGEAPPNWDGEEGFIDEEMMQRFLKSDPPQAHKVVICGGVNMAITCCYGLRSIGFKPSQIFVYGFFGAEVIKKVFGGSVKLTTHKSSE